MRLLLAILLLIPLTAHAKVVKLNCSSPGDNEVIPVTIDTASATARIAQRTFNNVEITGKTVAIAGVVEGKAYRHILNRSDGKMNVYIDDKYSSTLSCRKAAANK